MSQLADAEVTGNSGNGSAARPRYVKARAAVKRGAADPAKMGESPSFGGRG
jgi:hypothetical protein